MKLPTYDVSLQRTKNIVARHWTVGKHRDRDAITIYLPKLIDTPQQWWDDDELWFDDVVTEIIHFTLLERFCLEARINNRIRVERGLSKVCIKGRCKPFQSGEHQYSCKMHYITAYVIWGLEQYTTTPISAGNDPLAPGQTTHLPPTLADPSPAPRMGDRAGRKSGTSIQPPDKTQNCFGNYDAGDELCVKCDSQQRCWIKTYNLAWNDKTRKWEVSSPK